MITTATENGDLLQKDIFLQVLGIHEAIQAIEISVWDPSGKPVLLTTMDLCLPSNESLVLGMPRTVSPLQYRFHFIFHRILGCLIFFL